MLTPQELIQKSQEVATTISNGFTLADATHPSDGDIQAILLANKSKTDDVLIAEINNYYNGLEHDVHNEIKRIELFFEGELVKLEAFALRIIKELPPLAVKIFNELCKVTNKGANMITYSTVTAVLTALSITLGAAVAAIVQIILLVATFILKSYCK